MFAVVAMPKAAVNENHGFLFGQHYVWASRQVLPVQAEAKSHPVQNGTNTNLGLSVFRTNSRHITASLFFAVNVNHF